MSMLKTGGLALAFTLVADMAMAGGLGMIGVHGYVVDAGVSLGEAWDVPQIDWINLWENQELNFINTTEDPCFAKGGHYHGNFCHVAPGTDIAQLDPSLLNQPSPSAPTPSFEEKLTFDP